MSLTVSTKEKRVGVFVVAPVGSLNTETHPVLERTLDSLIEAKASEIVLDMAGLDYISSAGVRVVFRTKKALKKKGGTLILMSMQPQIEKVFDIIDALPSFNIFSSLEELDSYLDDMQRKITE